MTSYQIHNAVEIKFFLYFLLTDSTVQCRIQIRFHTDYNGSGSGSVRPPKNTDPEQCFV